MKNVFADIYNLSMYVVGLKPLICYYYYKY